MKLAEKLVLDLKRRHAWLEHELRAERSRRARCPEKMQRLKKLKLAVKDRLANLAADRRRQLLPQPA